MLLAKFIPIYYIVIAIPNNVHHPYSLPCISVPFYLNSFSPYSPGRSVIRGISKLTFKSLDDFSDGLPDISSSIFESISAAGSNGYSDCLLG